MSAGDELIVDRQIGVDPPDEQARVDLEAASREGSVRDEERCHLEASLSAVCGLGEVRGYWFAIVSIVWTHVSSETFGRHFPTLSLIADHQLVNVVGDRPGSRAIPSMST